MLNSKLSHVDVICINSVRYQKLIQTKNGC